MARRRGRRPAGTAARPNPHPRRRPHHPRTTAKRDHGRHGRARLRRRPHRRGAALRRGAACHRRHGGDRRRALRRRPGNQCRRHGPRHDRPAAADQRVAHVLPGRRPRDARHHRLRPCHDLPVRSRRVRRSHRGIGAGGPGILSRAALSGIRHPAPGADSLRAQLAAHHSRRQCAARRDRAAARQRGTRPRPVDEHPAQRIAGPRRIPQEHGRRGLDVGIDPAAGQALGAARLPPLYAAPCLVRAPDRRRAVRTDVFAADGEPRARQRERVRSTRAKAASSAHHGDGRRSDPVRKHRDASR